MNRRERRTQWQASHRHAAPQSSMLPGRSASVSAPAVSAVRMQIGELVLRGFEKRHASRIAAAFERSLDERLRGGALPDALGHRMASSSLRLAPLTLRRTSDPVAIGEQLAASVFAFERESRRRGGPR
jgi:hypothetical protein